MWKCIHMNELNIVKLTKGNGTGNTGGIKLTQQAQKKKQNCETLVAIKKRKEKDAPIYTEVQGIFQELHYFPEH